MSKKSKIAIGVAAIIIAVGVGAGVWYWRGQGGITDLRSFEALVKDRADLSIYFDRIKTAEGKIQKDGQDTAAYVSLGLAWKSLGELSNIEIFFQKSLETYERGIAKFGDKNILFYLNAGKVAERLNYLDKAEQYYKKAIEISSADDSGYLSLADLYIYKMNKTKEEILAVYNSGMGKMMTKTTLVAARATYLRRIGDNQAALVDYKTLSGIYPNLQGYKDIIAELEAKIKSGK